MTLIIILIIIGIFLLAVEAFLLPGITVAGVGSFISCGVAVYRAFVLYGNLGGFLTLAAVIILAIIALAICLRAKTWDRFTLKTEIDSSSQTLPQLDIKIGDTGVAITRLAPMGKVLINEKTYEAKSIDKYIDQRSEIEVVDFENFSVIVRKTN